MKAFFQKIVSFLHILFGVDLDTWINDHVQPSIEFVQNLKKIVDSPVVNLLTALVPGDADDKLRDFLSNNLAKAINLLGLTHDIVAETDLTNKILKTVSYIRGCSDSMRAAIYKQLAADMAKLSAGTNTIKNHSVDLLVQMQYSKLKEGLEADSLQTNSDSTPGATVLPTPPAPAEESETVDKPAPIVDTELLEQTAPVADIIPPVTEQPAVQN